MKAVIAIVEESANNLDTYSGGVAYQQGARNLGVANVKRCGRCCDGRQTYLCYTTDVLLAVFFGEPKIVVKTKTDIVSCELGQRSLPLSQVPRTMFLRNIKKGPLLSAEKQLQQAIAMPAAILKITAHVLHMYHAMEKGENRHKNKKQADKRATHTIQSVRSEAMM